MKKITLLLLLLAISFGYSQQTLQDFESGGLGDTFGGLTSGTIVADPEAMGTRGMVAELITSAAGEVWQGTNINISPNVLLTTDKTMTIDVYATTAISIAVKVTNSTDGGPDSTTSIDHTGSGWETLTATFNTSQDNSGVAEGNYSNFVVYPNWDPNTNTYINPAIVRTVYVDNISGLVDTTETCSDGILNNGETEIDCGGPNCGPCPPPDPAAAPNPLNYTTHLALLSDITDTSSFSNFWNPSYFFGSNQGTPDLDPTAGVNKAVKMDFSIEGWGGGIFDVVDVRTDISANDMVHIDYYVPTLDAGVNGHAFYLDLISRTAGGANTEAFYDFAPSGGDAPIVFDAWQSVDIPLSAFTGFVTTEFFQFKIGSPSDLNTTIAYFDNIYFYDSSTLSTNQFDTVDFKVYPNPTANNWNIESNTTIRSIAVYDILGKQVSSLRPNTTNAEINTANIRSGIYFAKIESNNGSKTVKLIKE